MRELLAEAVDFNAIAKSSIKLFITATNVHTRAVDTYSRNADITPDVLLASGCLPLMFQAVEINGEFYWDGGYIGNPTITPTGAGVSVTRHDSGADQSDQTRYRSNHGARHP